MSTLSDYNEAVRAFERGDSDVAAARLSRALGSDTTLPVVRHSLDKLIHQPPEALADGLLRLMAAKR